MPLQENIQGIALESLYIGLNKLRSVVSLIREATMRIKVNASHDRYTASGQSVCEATKPTEQIYAADHGPTCGTTGRFAGTRNLCSST